MKRPMKSNPRLTRLQIILVVRQENKRIDRELRVLRTPVVFTEKGATP